LAAALAGALQRRRRHRLQERRPEAPRLFADLGLARGDGRHARLMRTLGAVKLLILDDWGLEPLGPDGQRDLLELAEDRYGPGNSRRTLRPDPPTPAQRSGTPRMHIQEMR
jgi:DNA replication protein DnaC